MMTALLKRKQAAFREKLYLQGIVASTTLNCNRGKESDRVFGPWDFVPDPEAQERRDQTKRNVFAFFGMLLESAGGRVFDFEAMRQRTVEKLLNQGHADAEEIVDEVFVAWKMKRDKEAKK